MSATLTVPKGRPPKGGWPPISSGHGTTGIADQCAPSRDSPSNPAHGLIGYACPLLRRWAKAGYAVVRTDYEGLGTPGDHPYLVGRSEGRSMVDAARAARRLDRRIGRRIVFAGHSQGGRSALFAASLARAVAPELRVRGTVALAPVSHLAEQAALLPSLKTPSALSGLVAMILRDRRRNHGARRRWDSRRPRAVFKTFTDPLVDDYRKRGNPVTYKTYEGVDHAGAVENARSARDATAYIRHRLR